MYNYTLYYIIIYYNNTILYTILNYNSIYTTLHTLFFVDPSWGVNKFGATARNKAAKFTLKYYEYDPSRLEQPQRLAQITAYDRCKANRRCNWGIVGELFDYRTFPLSRQLYVYM